MIHGDYNLSHKQGLVKEAQHKTSQVLSQLTPRQRDAFTLRLAGLTAMMWPTSQDAECLSAIEDAAMQVLS